MSLRHRRYATSARELTTVEVAATVRQVAWGEAEVGFGDVLVTRQVVSFAKRRLDTGQPFGVEALDLPPRTLRMSSNGGIFIE